MTKLTKQEKEQLLEKYSRYAGFIIGSIVCGLIGFGIGLIFLIPSQAMVVGIITGIVAGITRI